MDIPTVPPFTGLKAPKAAYRVVLGDWSPRPSSIQLNEEGLVLAFSDSVQRLDF